MILSLVRRDPVLRVSALPAVTLLLTAGLVIGVLVMNAARGGVPVPATGLLVLGWFTVAPMFLLGRWRSRCGAMDLGLPIPARRLWVAHLLASILATGALAAAYVAVIVLVRRGLPGRMVLEIDALRFGMLLIGAAMLAAVLLQAPRPSLAHLPFSRSYAAWSAVVLLSPGALLPFLAAVPAGPFLLPVLALAGGIWIGNSLPPAFVLAPRDPGPARPVAGTAASVADDGAHRADPRRVAACVVLRCLTAGAKEWLAYPMIVLFGLMLSDIMNVWLGEAALRDLRFFYLPMSAYILFALFAPRLGLLQHLDPLPVPRRAMFAGLVLPSLVAFVLAYGAGTLAAARAGLQRDLVNFIELEDGWAVTAPLRVHRLAWDGRAPEIGSPWGESHPAEPAPLVRGAPVAVYSPYSAPAGSSAGFVALQISRAVEAVYGTTIPPAEIERRYIETRPDGSVAGRSERMSLVADFPGLRPRAGPVSSLMLPLAIVPYLLAAAALLRAYRAGLGEWVRQSIVWGFLAFAMIAWIGLTAGMMTGVTPPWIVRALVEIPAYALGRLPFGAALAWLAGLLAIAGAYRLAEVQFVRMEIPQRPGRYTLIDYLHGGPEIAESAGGGVR